MTTYYSDNADRIYDGKKALRGGIGPVFSMTETYEAAALASGSTVNMFKPPKGFKYLGLGQLAWDDLSDADTVTVSVGVGITAAGTVADVDAFLAATSMVAAADKADLDAGAIAITMLGYEFDGETWVTLTSAGNAAASGTIKLNMLFMGP